MKTLVYLTVLFILIGALLTLNGYIDEDSFRSQEEVKCEDICEARGFKDYNFSSGGWGSPPTCWCIGIKKSNRVF